MKVLSVSDRVEQIFYQSPMAPRFKNVDFILACGDLPPEYLTYLTEHLSAPLYFVRGNHDLRIKDDSPAGCININGRIIRHKGIKILGLEGSRWYNGGPFQYTENQMRLKVWRLYPQLWIRAGVDIIITHAPPRFMGDAEDPCHRGFRAFRKLIDRCSPKYFLHGHIHAHFEDDSERLTRVGSTDLINTFGHYMFEIN